MRINLIKTQSAPMGQSERDAGLKSGMGGMRAVF